MQHKHAIILNILQISLLCFNKLQCGKCKVNKPKPAKWKISTQIGNWILSIWKGNKLFRGNRTEKVNMGWFTYFTYRASKKYDLQFAISSVFHNKAIQYWDGDHLKGPNLTNTMYGQNEFRGLCLTLIFDLKI